MSAEEVIAASAKRKPRLTFVPVMLGGVLAAALAAIASAKGWASTDSGDASLLGSTLKSSGQLPLASALSLAALASWGALLVTRGRWRRGIALVGLLLAVGSLATAIAGYWKAPDEVRQAAITALGSSLAGSTSLSGWYWVALVADVLVVFFLAIAVRDAAKWPSMSTRYDSPTGAKGSAAGRRQLKTSLDVWKAFDEGEDPTQSPDTELPDS